MQADEARLKHPRTHSTLILSALLLALLSGFLTLLHLDAEKEKPEEPIDVEHPAPADLAELRDEFIEGMEALQSGDGERAIERLSSISFEPRAVEEYRLFYLANSYQLTGDTEAARRTLALLWKKKPRMLYREDAGFTLGTSYENAGAWAASARVYAGLAEGAPNPVIAAAAGSRQIETSFFSGDLSGVLTATRALLIANPSTEPAAEAAILARALRSIPATEGLRMSNPDRLERIESFLRDSEAGDALRELEALEPADLTYSQRQRVTLARGQALHRLRRFEESDRVLSPLLGAEYRYAIPAVETSARNNSALAASINPKKKRTIKEKKRAGTRKVKRKGKTVRVPNFKTVTRTIEVIDLELKARKEELDRRYIERLNDLLQLPSDGRTHKFALEILAQIAIERGHQDELESRVAMLIKLDPSTEIGLQESWNKGWKYFSRGDDSNARPIFLFIANTYQNPNIQRQSRYWHARSSERSGEPQRAKESYQELANAPYVDLYSVFSVRRGAKRVAVQRPNPLKLERPDWAEIAEHEMPAELRMGYELGVLGALREARIEVQARTNDGNRNHADAILGDIFFRQGAFVASHRFLRRAFPKLGSTEQDEVPAHMLRLYYPIRYEDQIRANAKKRNLDPYLVMGVIRQESIYEPTARSHAGATGLMQLMPATAKEFSIKVYGTNRSSRLVEPEINLELGTHYLQWVQSFVGGGTELALAAYNAGPGYVRRWRRAAPRKPIDEFVESIPFSETRGYVKRITLYRSTYERLYED